jgi:hypothetical protein
MSILMEIDDETRKKGKGWSGTDADRSIDQISLAFPYVCVSVFVVCSFLIVQIDECAAARQISSIDIIRKFLGGKQRRRVMANSNHIVHSS